LFESSGVFRVMHEHHDAIKETPFIGGDIAASPEYSMSDFLKVILIEDFKEKVHCLFYS